MRKSFTKGFTLIELLVVIAIIGILASIVLVSLNSARIKSRDASRVASLQEMAKAVQVADTDPTPSLTVCVGAGANANTCTGVTGVTFTPGWSNYNDPTVGGAGTLCAPALSSAVAAAACQYSIGQAGAAGAVFVAAATSQNFRICSVLETGNKAYGGTAATFGSVHVGSDTGGSVIAGC